jgi:hypothetical protein
MPVASSGALTTGSGSTTPCYPVGDFNIWLSGTWTGSIYPECFDTVSQTWVRMPSDNTGTLISWTSNGKFACFECEINVQWRLTYTVGSGTLNYRISQ